MKRWFVVFLCAAAVCAAGCSKSGDQGQTGSAQAQSGGTARIGAKGSLPLATTKPVLTMYIAGGINEVTTSFDPKDNKLTKKIIDETGIDLRITATPAADAVERLNVLLNAGDYPDIISYDRLDIEYYGENGTFIPLDQYDPLSFPNIKRIFTENPQVPQVLTGSDGKLYALPAANQCLHCTYSYGRIWYYMPWIRDTGRKAPETLDEFTEFLRWAKNSDPNGNGKKDEMGIVFSKDDVLNFIAKIAKAYMPFVYTNKYFGLALDSGKQIVEQYRDPRFRDALRYIAEIYKEGLIERDAFSMSQEQEMAITRSEPATSAVVGASWINAYAQPGTQRFLDYFYVPALKGPNGEQWASNTDTYGDVWAIYYITDKCKDPELAIALYDYINSPEVGSVYGMKGEYWDNADPGTFGFDGKPAVWKQLLEFGNQPLNSGWHNSNIRTFTQAWRVSMQSPGVPEMQRFLSSMDKSLESQVMANPSYLEYMFYWTSVDAQKHAIPTNMFIPPQVLNGQDNTRVADINAVLDPFKTQACVEFITGVRNINNDSDWNAYLAELDRLGSPDMVKIRQKYVK